MPFGAGSGAALELADASCGSATALIRPIATRAWTLFNFTGSLPGVHDAGCGARCPRYVARASANVERLDAVLAADNVVHSGRRATEVTGGRFHRPDWLLSAHDD